MGRNGIGTATMGRRTGIAIAMLTLALAAAGCGMQLETGYAYRPLNSTDAQRKAYYASPFTPEKAGADNDKGGGPAPSLGGINSNLH